MSLDAAPAAAIRTRRLGVAETSVLLVVAAAAWLATIAIATDMDVMPGTMGLGWLAFLGVWTLMRFVL